MWADSPATTMSIVICAGVPRAPLVDSHHLHGPISRGESELGGKRVVLPPPSRTIHNARGESPGYRRSSSDFASLRHLHYDFNRFLCIAFFDGEYLFHPTTLLIMNDIIKCKIITSFDQTERVKKIKSLITNSKMLINYYFSQN